MCQNIGSEAGSFTRQHNKILNQVICWIQQLNQHSRWEEEYRLHLNSKFNSSWLGFITLRPVSSSGSLSSVWKLEEASAIILGNIRIPLILFQSKGLWNFPRTILLYKNHLPLLQLEPFFKGTHLSALQLRILQPLLVRFTDVTAAEWSSALPMTSKFLEKTTIIGELKDPFYNWKSQTGYYLTF